MSTRPLLTILLPVRDGAADLPQFLDSASRYADAVVAVDDGSADDSVASLDAHPIVKVLKVRPRRASYAGWDDAANRNETLAAAAELDPIWLLSLDADERIDEADGRAMRAFLETDALPGLAYALERFEMRGTEGLHLPLGIWQQRLFAFEPGQRFPTRRLHFAPIPVSIPRSAVVNTTFRIQHHGGATLERRRAQYEKYRLADPDCRFWPDYTAVLDDDPRQVPVAWAERRPDQPSIAVPAPAAPVAEETMTVFAPTDARSLGVDDGACDWIVSDAPSPLLRRDLIERASGSVVLALPPELAPETGAVERLLAGHAAGYALVAPVVEAPGGSGLAERLARRRYAPTRHLPEGSMLDTSPVVSSFRRSLLLETLADDPPPSMAALSQRLYRAGYLCLQSAARLRVIEEAGPPVFAAARAAFRDGRAERSTALERHRLSGRLLRPATIHVPRDIPPRPFATDPLPPALGPVTRAGSLIELVAPRRGKLTVLIGAPQLIALWDVSAGDRRRLALVSWSRAKCSVRVVWLPASLRVERGDGSLVVLGEAIPKTRRVRRFELHELLTRPFAVPVDDYVRLTVGNAAFERRGFVRAIAIPTLRAIRSVETTVDRPSLALVLLASLGAKYDELALWPDGGAVRPRTDAADEVKRFFAGHTELDRSTMRGRLRLPAQAGEA